MQCPNCGTENSSNYRFCLKCGTPLEEAVGTSKDSDKIEPEPLEQSQQPKRTSTRARTSKPPQASSTQALTYLQYANRIASDPFAGIGTRQRQKGWLLPEYGARYSDIVQTLEEVMKSRPIGGAILSKQVRSLKGPSPDNRVYYMLKRASASTGLHVMPFGQDVYITQVSSFKTPLSPLRIGLLSLMIIYLVISYFIPDLREGVIAQVNGLLLMGFLIFSLYRYFSSSDILAGLRRFPNPFDYDDLTAMELSAQHSLQQALKTLEIPLDDLKESFIFDRKWNI